MKAGDRVVCVDDTLSFGALTKGSTYRVLDEHPDYANVVRVVGGDGLIAEAFAGQGTWWLTKRFKPAAEVPTKTGTRALKCSLSPGSCSGQVDIPPAGTVCGETMDCPYKEKLVASDLDHLQALLSKGGANLRSWRIGSYVDRDGNDVRMDGWVLVHGSQDDDGPYTQYLFDAAGALLPNGVSTICFDNGVLKEAR